MEPNKVNNFVTRLRSLPTPVPEPVQIRTNPILDIGSRWESCLFLHQSSVPYKIWSDSDVFGAHGLYSAQDAYQDPYGPQVSDVHALVHDVEEAAAVLEGAGYFRTRLRGNQQDEMGYIPGAKNHKFIRLLNVGAIVERNAPWKTFDQVAQEIAYAAAGPGDPMMHSSDIKQNTAGVFLMRAKDWNYSLPLGVGLAHEPVPELSEYFNSYTSLWMQTPMSRVVTAPRGFRIEHLARILNSLCYEADVVGSEEFDKAVKKKNRQFLFDLLKLRWDTDSLLEVFTSDSVFQAYSKSTRKEIRGDLRQPELPDEWVRQRPQKMIYSPRPRGRADEQGYKSRLPRLTWLARVPRGDGWWVLSLNVGHMLKRRKEERKKNAKGQNTLREEKGIPLGERAPIEYQTLEYQLLDVLANAQNWAYQ